MRMFGKALACLILSVALAVPAVPAVPAAGSTIPDPTTGAGQPGNEPGRVPMGWDLAAEIRDRVVPPDFPDFEVSITDFGADPTGEHLSTAAFRDAIEEVSAAGGGRVVIPAGEFLTGAIHLRSNVELHVGSGAVVRFSQNPDHYLPAVYTRWEGVELYNYSPFIYARGVENVAITGSGVLDGQADEKHWWNWSGSTQAEDRETLFRMGEQGVPVEQRRFGAGHHLRPNFVQFYDSRNILVQGVTLKNSPMWMIHPVLSHNITVDGVVLDSPEGPNNDGVNPESSRDVVIKNSRFDNGDDCIAIKSGRNADGRRIGVPSENILIENNHMQDGHGGVVMGSEMSGSVRNVFAQHNVMDSPNLHRALRIKTNSVRGGIVENVYFRHNTVVEIGDEVIRVNFFYEEADSGPHTPIVRNIHIEDLRSDNGEYALYLRGYERSPVSNVTVTDSVFTGVEHPQLLENVQGLRMRNVTINGESHDTGHVCDGRVWSGYVLTGVTDRALDEGRCLSDLIADDGGWRSQDFYRAHVNRVTAQLVHQGAITPAERGELREAARQPVSS
ncbi:glycoside hydrolase family 28 protein [Saccharomonospora cyanea]|uniref:Endopolygalacturonase n=1 Tax=Saccharomonospora cyanea NA-134 TaxID=882082 RepID=H5XG10_9PSEU|nr:glycoside hydrolase family 28 protein [Saccharomonospora cyanea]EHR61566.1 endopolygalacturonase [Saccharomonospora cyanea NA-134]